MPAPLLNNRGEDIVYTHDKYRETEGINRDYAKTLYKPTRPKEWDERLKKTDSNKLPAFFEYAKGKEPSQITARGRGVVDRIYYIICNYKFRFDKSIVGKFDPKMLMYEPLEKYGDTEESIVSYFRKKSQTICANNNTVAYSDDNKYWFSVKELRKDMQKFGSAQKITDILVYGLFIEHNVRKKSIFWDCFGDVVELNLTNNLRENRGRCLCCGKYFKVEFGANDTLCPTCRPKKAEAIRTAECSVCGEPFKTRSFLPVAICPACQMVKRSLNKCMDCGTPIRNTGGKGRPSCRCRDCQSIRNKQKTREWKIKYKKESR